MKIEIHELETTKIAEIIADNVIIENAEDGLQLLVDVYYQDIDQMIIYEKNITPHFFDLKSLLAGEILQKFANYRMRLFIIGEFENVRSQSLTDFILESNQGKHVNFVGSMEEVIEKLTR